MGCHTWFYTPAKEQTDYETAREKVMTDIMTDIRFYENIKSNTLSKDDKEYYDDHKQMFDNFIDRGIVDVRKRQYEMVSKRYCQKATMSKYAGSSRYVYSHKTNTFYTETEYHDVFRVSDYPTDELFSLDDAIKFISTHRIVLTADEIIRINNFWSKYPNGMIHFG